ncbi:MAG: aminotransferase class IV [Candidatus Promineifilaceae bacterium]
MSTIQFFAITLSGITPLPIPKGAQTIHDLFDDLKLGVYTTFCTFEHNKFLYLDAHLDRLQNSVNLMGWDYPLDQHHLRQVIHQLCTAYPQQNSQGNSRVRLDVLAEPPTTPPGSETSRLTIALSPFPSVPPELYTQGVEVGFADHLHRDRPLIKDAHFVLQRRSYQSGSYYEQLLIDENGNILEGMTSNFYGIRDGVLYTAGAGVLEGVARRIVLQQAEKLGIPVRLEAIHINDIANLNEAALSSSSRALVPIVKIGGQIIGNGRPGPITRQILEAYRAFLTREIRPAITNR